MCRETKTESEIEERMKAAVTRGIKNRKSLRKKRGKQKLDAGKRIAATFKLWLIHRFPVMVEEAIGYDRGTIEIPGCGVYYAGNNVPAHRIISGLRAQLKLPYFWSDVTTSYIIDISNIIKKYE